MTLSNIATSLGVTESQLAALEVFLNQNCGLPEAVDFTNPAHLRALAYAIDKLQSVAPLLVLALRVQAEEIEELRERDDLQTARVDDLEHENGGLEEERDKLAAEVEALKASKVSTP